jgi:hypothetical protein
MKKNSAAVLFALSILLVISPVTSSAEEDREGYWELAEVRHELKHFNEELVDKDYWSDSMSGSAGAGNFTSTYVGPTEDDDYAPRPKNGESGTVTGSVSTPPQYIDGGKTVKLSVDLSVTSTKQHFFDFDGHAYARFDETDVPMGHVSWGAIDFTANDPDGEKLDLSVWLYGPTNWRAKEYGNNPTVNTEVSAQAPYSSEEGDEISIYTQIGMGNMSSRTEYVYRWHAEGKAPAPKKTRDGKGSPLTWMIPAGILIGGGGYMVNRARRKKKKKSDDRTASPEVIKYKRDRLRKEADKGNRYADRLAGEYNEMLKSVEWNGGKLGFGKEEKFKKLNRLYKKFMRGEVGGEEEAPDELGRLETETSGGRFQRNLNRWKETTKKGAADTFEEAVKGDTAKSVIFRAGIGALTGGHSETVFAPAEGFYTMKDAVEEGKSVKEAVTKAYTDLAIDVGVGKATEIGISPTKAGKAGRFFADPNNNKALEFAEKTISEAYANGVKSAVEMGQDIYSHNTRKK